MVHLGVCVDEADRLLVHLEDHVLGPDLPFGVQETQLPDPILDGDHGLFPIHHKRGQVLRQRMYFRSFGKVTKTAGYDQIFSSNKAKSGDHFKMNSVTFSSYH